MVSLARDVNDTHPAVVEAERIIVQTRMVSSTIENTPAVTVGRSNTKLIDSVIGPSDPLDAIKVELAHPDRTYDSIIISTLPPGLSCWAILCRNCCG